jgi:hypothetical protein
MTFENGYLLLKTLFVYMYIGSYDIMLPRQKKAKKDILETFVNIFEDGLKNLHMFLKM